MRYFMSMMLLFILSGCGVTSKHPLTPFDDNQIDTNIFGTWLWNEEEKTEYIHVGMDENTGLLKVVMVIMHESGESSLLEFTGHTSKVAEDDYLNLRLVQPKEEHIDDYIFFKYNVTQDRLSMGIMNSDMVIESIKSGTLKGWVSKKGFFTNVYLNESGEKLQRYIATHGKELFLEIRAFRKVDVSKYKKQKAEVER